MLAFRQHGWLSQGGACLRPTTIVTAVMSYALQVLEFRVATTAAGSVGLGWRQPRVSAAQPSQHLLCSVSSSTGTCFGGKGRAGRGVTGRGALPCCGSWGGYLKPSTNDPLPPPAPGPFPAPRPAHKVCSAPGGSAPCPLGNLSKLSGNLIIMLYEPLTFSALSRAGLSSCLLPSCRGAV